MIGMAWNHGKRTSIPTGGTHSVPQTLPRDLLRPQAISQKTEKGSRDNSRESSAPAQATKVNP
jgi:hypothetical protein